MTPADPTTHAPSTSSWRHSDPPVSAAVAHSWQRASQHNSQQWTELLAAISDTVREPFIAIDSTGHIVHLNAQAVCQLGDSRTAVLGRPINQLFSDAGALLDVLTSHHDYNNRLLHRSHGHGPINSSGRALFNSHQQLIGAVALLHPAPRRHPQQARYRLDDLLGNSDSMKQCRKMALTAATSPSTVLIHGESGTGKELLAQGIHNASERSEQPFVAINCAAITETLLESELFGYEEGAFTGAKRGGQPGKVEIANGGTLFLDEIGDMPLPMQVKLLRMLQERQICRVGSGEPLDVDLRIIAATHKDLPHEIQAGTFRRDLYYRINVLPITLPPLRERNGDLKLLLDHLVVKYCRLLNKQVTLTPSFIAACQSYSWPGNVRELENSIERAINLVADGGNLTREQLQVDSIELGAISEQISGVLPLKQMELEMINRALMMARGNIVQASNLLGISRNTIYRKIKEHDIIL